jgi:antitoxin HigA-1
MRNTKRRPISVGEILLIEFLKPMNIEISELADAMGVHRNTLSRIVHDKGMLTGPMAIRLAAALGNTPEFWLNIQHAVEIWDAQHSYEQEAKNVKRVRPHLEQVAPAKVYEAIMDLIEDKELLEIAKSRMNEESLKINLDDL